MTEPSSSNPDRRDERSVLAMLLLPLSFFPLVALLTYDWHAIAALAIPPAPSSNWVGALGDGFAYGGYKAFGLAIWSVPPVAIAVGCAHATGRRFVLKLRSLWLLVLLAALASLVQIAGEHSPVLAALVRRLNVDAAGGFTGYLLMSRFLAPLVGGFGATIAMAILATASLILAVGLDRLRDFFVGLWRWSTNGLSEPVAPTSGDTEDEARYLAEQAEYMAALQAKADAKAQAAAEKARIKAEKEAAKAQREAEKEAERERIRAAREAARAEAKAKVKGEGGGGETSDALGERALPAKDESPADKGPYLLPGLDLLAPLRVTAADHSDVEIMSARIINTLKLYKIDATLSFTVQGPVVTKYAIKLAEGIPYMKVKNHELELMGALHAKSLRIEAPIPGKEEVGIEVPNTKPASISFREIFVSEAWQGAVKKMALPLLFGKDASGKELVADLASMPHMLVAGATGQGKSVCLNSILCGLLMTRTPQELKLIMVDPKSVEFAAYAKIPHLLIPVIADNNKVVKALMWAVVEMEKRLKLFTRARVRNIYDYNHRKSFTQTDMFGQDTEIGTDMPKTLPYIVIIIDEVADLMMQCAKVVTPPISRIAAKARAAGIHLILATQRPDAKIITGSIKANIPGRVAFKTSSAVDSRTILDDSGAENLIGRGDMLFKGKDGILVRAQGSWISDEEIANVTAFIEEHANTQFDEKFAKNLARVQEAGVEDPFADLNEEDAKAAAAENRAMVKAEANASDFKKAVECVINTKRASVSHFQRQMGWGYNHAAKILDQLTDRGIVAPPEGMGPRRIIMDEDAMTAILREGDGEEAQGEGPSPGEEGIPDSPTSADTAPTDFKLEG